MGQLTDFLVEMGATHSVQNTKITNKSLAVVSVTGVTEQLQKQAFLQSLECQCGDQKFTHSFLYMRFPNSTVWPRFNF